jgi:hypothetical protein
VRERMKKILIAISIIAIAAMMIFSFSGCAAIAAKAVQKAVEKAASAEGASVDLSSGQVNVKDSSGNEVNIGSNKVPDNWPSAVPVNPSITIQLSGSNKDNGKTTFTISGTSTGTGADLYNWYKQQLASWSLDSDSTTDSGGTKTYTGSFSNDTYESTIFITDDGKQVAVILTVSEK